MSRIVYRRNDTQNPNTDPRFVLDRHHSPDLRIHGDIRKSRGREVFNGYVDIPTGGGRSIHFGLKPNIYVPGAKPEDAALVVEITPEGTSYTFSQTPLPKKPGRGTAAAPAALDPMTARQLALESGNVEAVAAWYAEHMAGCKTAAGNPNKAARSMAETALAAFQAADE